MNTETYSVVGMTCGHCVSSVTTELTALDDVSDVQVDLSTGAVTVTSSAPLDPSAVQAAVEEAGFEMAAS